MEKKNSELVCLHLIDIYRKLGLSKKAQSDQGKEFKGKVKKLFNGNGAKMINSAPYKPQRQGKIERSYGTWKRKVAYDLTKNKSYKCIWLKWLGEYAYQYNTSPHLSIGFRTPFEVFYGREATGIVFESYSDVVSDSSLLSDMSDSSNEDNDLELNDSTNDENDGADKENYVKNWFKDVNAIHENCSKTQEKVDEKMIHRHLAMFSPAEYEKEGSKTRKKAKKNAKKRLDMPSAFPGKIVERKGYRYKVRYSNEAGNGNNLVFP